MIRHWKDAATVLIAAKNGAPTKCGFNYKLLLLKRSSKSKFMANAVVFPGGICDQSDFDKKWDSLFLEKHKIQTKKLLEDIPRPPMFATPEFQGLHPELGFRITAIRETFEESGIPLFVSLKYPESDNTHHIVNKYGSTVLETWREKIDKNSSEFINMCTELQLLPNIWCLKTWSNWLTPTFLQSLHGKANRRYDTIFYMCCLPYAPEPLHDDREVVSTNWLTPKESLLMNKNEQMWLAPPQIHELTRLCKMQNFNNLEMYSRERESYGCERWFPVKFTCNDGVISTLPGDDLYPYEPDLLGDYDVSDLNMTIEESRMSTSNVHRMEFYSRHDVVLQCSIDLPNKQLTPNLSQTSAKIEDLLKKS